MRDAERLGGGARDGASGWLSSLASRSFAALSWSLENEPRRFSRILCSCGSGCEPDSVSETCSGVVRKVAAGPLAAPGGRGCYRAAAAEETVAVLCVIMSRHLLLGVGGVGARGRCSGGRSFLRPGGSRSGGFGGGLRLFPGPLMALAAAPLGQFCSVLGTHSCKFCKRLIPSVKSLSA